MNRYYLAAALLVLAVLSVFFPHVVPFVLGVWPVPAGTSPFYQFWSGFFIVVLSMVTSSWLRKQNCHVRWCWRLGRFPVVTGSSLFVCRHHHPDPDIRHNKVTYEHVLHLHQKHAEARNNPGWLTG